MADWDLNNPGDSDFISQYPPNERAARSAVRTNFGVDHHETDDADVGKHEHATMLDKGGDPTAASGQGVFYAKTVSGEIEAFYMDASGNAVQLTVNGKINALRFGETNTLGQTQLIEAAGGLNYWGVKSTDDSSISAFAVLDSAGNSILRIIGTGMDGAGAGRARFNDADYYEFIGGGIVIGSPTGGSKGGGSVNAEEIYRKGTDIDTRYGVKSLGNNWSATNNFNDGVTIGGASNGLVSNVKQASESYASQNVLAFGKANIYVNVPGLSNGDTVAYSFEGELGNTALVLKVIWTDVSNDRVVIEISNTSSSSVTLASNTVHVTVFSK